MSRAYNMTVRVKSKKISEKQLLHVMTKTFGWTEEDISKNGENDYFFMGSGSLCGGKGEEEAHKEIFNALKRRDSKAKIQTTWTYMEDLPYETYGEKMED